MNGSEIVRLPRMGNRDIKELLGKQNLCRIAFKGSDYPYIAPFQYVQIGDTLYFHFTNYGRKMNLLERDRRVCVEVESYKPDMSEYSFVVMQGYLQVVEDPKERGKAIQEMARLGSERLSENFLVAHGFNPEAGWSIFNSDNPLIIMKLREVSDVIGLKYP